MGEEPLAGDGDSVTAKEKRAAIDAYGALHKQQKEIEAHLGVLKGQVMAQLPADHPPGEAFLLEGDEFTIIIKAAEWKREILDMFKLVRRVGREAFLTACSFPLGVLDKLIPDEAERAKYVSREQTGPRKLEVVKKFNAAK